MRLLDTRDVRFPTSTYLDGSDAMNPDPDYSAAYAVLTDASAPDLEGHGFAFTIGRGNEVVLTAIEALRPAVEALDLPKDAAGLGELARELNADSQLRWLGPEKGVMQLAVAAVVNAVWDLYCKVRGEPLWRVLSGLSPEEVVSLVDFRYLTDALTPEQALALLQDRAAGREDRLRELLAHGYPAYTTTPGWLGYSDEKMLRLLDEAVREGFRMVKLKVGADLDEDVRRCALARDAVGPDIAIAVDANQRWSVDEAIAWVGALSGAGLAWIEEPTSPDDVLGHAAIRRGVAPVPVATGEHVANRVVFKQYLQAGAIDVLQLDACRVAGVNENVAILLLAAHFGVPVCPHAGGVGLCEVVRHLSMFDHVSVSGTTRGRMIEYADHLHEHFVDPAVVVGGRYLAPTLPGASTELLPASAERFRFPGGAAWAGASA